MLRARMVTAIRRALDEEGFVEVETPVLQPRYGGAFARPFVDASQRARPDALPADRDRALPQAADRRRPRAGLRDRQGLPQRGRLVQAQPRVHDARVVRGLRRLPRHDGPHGAPRRRASPRETLGTTTVTFQGHEIDLGALAARASSPTRSPSQGLWTRDEDELRARLDERGVDTTHDRTWAQLIDHALSHFVEPRLIQPTILHDYPVELSPFARATDEDGDRRALRVLRRRHGARQRLHRDQRLRGAGGAVRDAGRGGRRRQRRGRAGRPRLRRGALLRHAADGRPRHGHRPPRDAAARQGLDPRRDPVPRPASASAR